MDVIVTDSRSAFRAVVMYKFRDRNRSGKTQKPCREMIQRKEMQEATLAANRTDDSVQFLERLFLCVFSLFSFPENTSFKSQESPKPIIHNRYS